MWECRMTLKILRKILNILKNIKGRDGKENWTRKVKKSPNNFKSNFLSFYLFNAIYIYLKSFKGQTRKSL